MEKNLWRLFSTRTRADYSCWRHSATRQKVAKLLSDASRCDASKKSPIFWSDASQCDASKSCQIIEWCVTVRRVKSHKFMEWWVTVRRIKSKKILEWCVTVRRVKIVTNFWSDASQCNASTKSPIFWSDASQCDASTKSQIFGVMRHSATRQQSHQFSGVMLTASCCTLLHFGTIVQGSVLPSRVRPHRQTFASWGWTLTP
jgi:hypothetical protein